MLLIIFILSYLTGVLYEKLYNYSLPKYGISLYDLDIDTFLNDFNFICLKDLLKPKTIARNNVDIVIKDLSLSKNKEIGSHFDLLHKTIYVDHSTNIFSLFSLYHEFGHAIILKPISFNKTFSNLFLLYFSAFMQFGFYLIIPFLILGITQGPLYEVALLCLKLSFICNIVNLFHEFFASFIGYKNLLRDHPDLIDYKKNILILFATSFLSYLSFSYDAISLYLYAFYYI